jgi:hypothetical protein
MIPLSKADIEYLYDEEASSTCDSNTAANPSGDAEPINSLIVVDNLAEDQALQINGLIGKDGWWKASQLVVRKNKATGTAIQTNVPISLGVFDKLLSHRSANLRG